LYCLALKMEALYLSKSYNYSSVAKASRPTRNKTSERKCSWKHLIKSDEVLLFWENENVDYVPIEALELSEHSVLYSLLT